jgi:hypothetical protein
MPIESVRLRQSGGFAGLIRSSELSGDALADSDRKALERQLERSRTAPVPRASAARDLVVYELEIETDAGPQRLEFDEANVPPTLAPLVERLAARAKPDGR